MVTFIFLANFTSGLYDYSVVTVKINKSPAPLQVAFVGIDSNPNTVSVGTEMSYIIDASASYDPDYPSSQS